MGRTARLGKEDYREGAAERSWGALADVGMSDRGLGGAVRVAGRQLDVLKLGGETPVVMVPWGTIVTVVADNRRSVVLYMTEDLGGFERVVREFLAENWDWGGRSSIRVALEALEEHGRDPAGHWARPVLDIDTTAALEVGLWAGLPGQVREAMHGLLGSVIRRGVCPAVVCLLGVPRAGKLVTIWPLLVPLARYAAVDDERVGLAVGAAWGSA